MSVYQISGLPGTGKTTIQHELDKLGYTTIDTDKAWGYYGNIETEELAPKPANITRKWFEDHGYIWNSETVRPLLRAPRTEPLFVCGGSRNQSKFYDLFAKIFVLHVPDDIMRARLSSRDDPNAREELFISRMIEYNRGTYENARQIGGIIIETTQPLDECMQIILGAIHADNRMA